MDRFKSFTDRMLWEYYAKFQFLAYGFAVYSSDVDNHGVDFVAKNKKGKYLEVQVKSICKANYMFIKKDKITLDNKHLVELMHLVDYQKPEMFIFPASVWKNINAVFRIKIIASGASIIVIKIVD